MAFVYNSATTLVTVAPNARLAVDVSGVVTIFLGGDTLFLPNYRIPILQQQGIIL